MKRTTGKRALALLCALLMTAALLPAMAYATTTEDKKAAPRLTRSARSITTCSSRSTTSGRK